MSKRILRPLDTGGLLDELFDLYRSKFLLLFGICAVIYIPIYSLLFASMKEKGAFISNFVALPLSYLVIAATTWAVSQTYLGNDTSIGGSFSAIFKRLPAFIGTMLITALVTLLGFALCFVPGIIFSLWYVFVSVVFVVEGKKGLVAMDGSKFLAKDELGRIFLFLLITGMAVGMLAGALTVPFQFALGLFGGQPSDNGVLWTFYGLAQGLASALISPVQVIVVVLLYYDIRVRKEGFDLQLLASSLGETDKTPEIDDQPVK